MDLPGARDALLHGLAGKIEDLNYDLEHQTSNLVVKVVFCYSSSPPILSVNSRSMLSVCHSA